MTMSDETRPATVATGHLVLTAELRDRIREQLLGMLDSTHRRLARDNGDGLARPGPGELVDATEAIQAALVKLDAGYYGVCETCERPIPFERLEAIPAVRNCVSCQAQPRPLVR
jgi:hypothetical protein